MAVPAEVAFDRYFQTHFPYVPPVRPEDRDARRFKGRQDLTALPPMLQDQLRRIQEMFNDALLNEKKNVAEHAEHLPFHVDYVEAAEQNAIAFRHDEYSFIALTTPLIFAISDVCLLLSQSEKVATLLGVRWSKEEYNELHAILFEILTWFVVTHEWSHHVHGHVLDGGNLFPAEILSHSGGSLESQIKEVVADGYSVYYELANLICGSGRRLILQHLGFDSEQPGLQDRVMFALFVIAVGGFMFMRPTPDLNQINIFAETHPPQAARMKLIMDEPIGWCRQNRPELESWMETQFQILMNAVAEAVLGVSAAQAWGSQVAFLHSEKGRKYIADLATGVDYYRLSWGDREGHRTREARRDNQTD